MDPVSHDKSVPFRNVFSFRNVREGFFEDCYFSNQKNVKIFHLSNWKTDSFLRMISKTNIVFNNITVVNSTDDNSKQGDKSLFSFYSTQKPVEIVFNNSIFMNNKFGKNASTFQKSKFYLIR